MTAIFLFGIVYDELVCHLRAVMAAKVLKDKREQYLEDRRYGDRRAVYGEYRFAIAGSLHHAQ
jgi:hypothetical protein